MNTFKNYAFLVILIGIFSFILDKKISEFYNYFGYRTLVLKRIIFLQLHFK